MRIHIMVQPTGPMSLKDGHYLLHVVIAMSRSRSPLIGQCEIHAKTRDLHVITGDICIRMAPWRLCRGAMKPEKCPRGVLPRGFHVLRDTSDFRLYNPCIFLCTRGESETWVLCRAYARVCVSLCAHLVAWSRQLSFRTLKLPDPTCQILTISKTTICHLLTSAPGLPLQH